MSEEIQTREEAVAWLSDQGFDSFQSDRPLKQAVVIGADKTESVGIGVWRFALHIANELDTWVVYDFDCPHPRRAFCESLHEATITARDLMVDKLRRAAETDDDVVDPLPWPSFQDRVIGSLLGGAIGDAFGFPYEGRVPPFEPEWSENPTVSDDTLLTLATCRAILDCKGISAEAIAEKFLETYRKAPPPGLGASTLTALRSLAAGAHWAMAGRKGEYAAGNGAAMRIAPLAFLGDPNDPKFRTEIRDVCRITHHSEEAYVGALAVIHAIRFALEAPSLKGLSAHIVQHLPDSRVRDALAELTANASIAQLAQQLGTSGFVAESVPLAIAAAETIPELDLMEIIRQVVACGGDTDTTASLVGQIGGASLGSAYLPRPHLQRELESQSIEAHAKLAARDRLSETVERFALFADSRNAER